MLRRRIADCLVIVLSATVLSLSYYLFVYPNEFAPSGLPGFFTLLQYLFHLNVGYLTFVINVPLVIATYLLVGKEYALKSALFTVVFSGLLVVLEYVPLDRFAYYTENGTSTIMAPIAGGVVSGFCYGIVMRRNSSTGGTDLVAAIVNRYFSFPEGHTTDGRPAGGFKKAHEDFRVVAAGNTLGTGADAAYTGRMQLDAASLNRFVVVPVDYDENIDLFNADGDTELVAFAKAYRKAAKKCGLFTVCSYRNLKQIKVAEVMGLESALLFCLAKELNKDDINILAKEVCMSEPNNRYAKAFKNIESMVC